MLKGFPAIVAAVDRWIQVDFSPNVESKKVNINSSLGQYTFNIGCPDQTTYPKSLSFVCFAIEHCPPPFGGVLNITADFPDNIGLGSSAAVCAATLACMNKANQKSNNPADLLGKCLRVIHSVQKIGSGTDAAASINGGVLSFHPRTKSCTKLPNIQGLSLHYCGYKTKTATAVQHVAKLWQGKEEALQKIHEKMSAISESVPANLNEPTRLAEAINSYHQLMVELGVEDKIMKQLRQKLLQQGASAVKISGSGLGDCLLSLNHPYSDTSYAKNYDSFALKIARRGLYEIT